MTQVKQGNASRRLSQRRARVPGVADPTNRPAVLSQGAEYIPNRLEPDRPQLLGPVAGVRGICRDHLDVGVFSDLLVQRTYFLAGFNEPRDGVLVDEHLVRFTR